MYDIKNLNIWKTDPAADGRLSSSEIQTLKAGSRQLDVYTGRTFTDTPLEELSLSVRSYNCLRRSGCRTIGDILSISGEDEQGLMKIRNLGVRSASEIMEKLAEYQQRLLTEEAASGSGTGRPASRKLIRPAGSMKGRRVDSFGLSDRSLAELERCGIQIVRDLYSPALTAEPGWFAVRELFDRIPG